MKCSLPRGGSCAMEKMKFTSEHHGSMFWNVRNWNTNIFRICPCVDVSISQNLYCTDMNKPSFSFVFFKLSLNKISLNGQLVAVSKPIFNFEIFFIWSKTHFLGNSFSLIFISWNAWLQISKLWQISLYKFFRWFGIAKAIFSQCLWNWGPFFRVKIKLEIMNQ